MKKFYTLITVSFLLCFNTQFAQISFQWAVGAGSSSDEITKDMVVDRSGNVYTTGFFDTSIDMDPGPGVVMLNAGGGLDVYVAKTNNAGNLVWAKRIGGTNNEQVSSITQDLLHNVYLTGWFEGTVDFDPGAGTSNMTAMGPHDAFICKLDSAGNFMWAKQFGGSNLVGGGDVVCDSLGNVYATGHFWATADFDPGAATFNLSSAGYDDAYILKLTSAGNFVWAKSIGTTDFEGGTQLELVLNGILISGYFSNTCDVDPGAGYFPLTSYGLKDIFILKWDNNGDFIWAGSMGSAFGGDHCEDMATDSLGNIYATGYFGGTFDLNPGPGTYTVPWLGSEDAFVIKLNALGGFVWGRAYGGPSQDNGRSIVVSNGNILITGLFSETCDFDPHDDYQYNLTTYPGQPDIYISQFDEYGNFVAVAAMGGPGADLGIGIGADSTGAVYICGGFGGYSTQPSDFDPSSNAFTMISNNSTYDIFIAKYQAAAKNLGVGHVVQNSSSIKLFPNPSNGIVRVSSTEKGYAEVFNSQGQSVKRFDYLGAGALLDISDQPSGIYMVYVITGTKSAMQKIVKE